MAQSSRTRQFRGGGQRLGPKQLHNTTHSRRASCLHTISRSQTTNIPPPPLTGAPPPSPASLEPHTTE